MSWTLTRCDYAVQFGGASHVGNVRKNNEDAWAIDPRLGLFVVADGMGGHAAGEVAAGMAVDTVCSSIQNRLAFEAFDAFLLSPTLEARAQCSERSGTRSNRRTEPFVRKATETGASNAWAARWMSRSCSGGSCSW